MTDEQIQTLTNLEFLLQQGITADGTVLLSPAAETRRTQIRCIHRIDYPYCHIEPPSALVEVWGLDYGVSSWQLCMTDGLVTRQFRFHNGLPMQNFMELTLRGATLLRDFTTDALRRLSRGHQKDGAS